MPTEQLSVLNLSRDEAFMENIIHMLFVAAELILFTAAVIWWNGTAAELSAAQTALEDTLMDDHFIRMDR